MKKKLLLLILIISLSALISTKNLPPSPIYPVERVYLEKIITDKNYPWIIKEAFSENHNNSSFMLDYSGEKDGQLYINSIVRDKARFIGVNRIKDDYIIDNSKIQNDTFLFDFVFALFGDDQYVDEIVLNFNTAINTAPKDGVKKIIWHYRLEDLVVRISAKYPGYGDYRVTSVWIYTVEAYELYINSKATTHNEKHL